MNVANEVATYLANQGLGTLGTDVFVGHQPKGSTYDNCITVYHTQGGQPDIYIPTAEPSFQIIVRNKVYETGLSKVNSIVDELHQKRNAYLVSGETYFMFILLETEPYHIGMDEQERHEWTLNFYSRTKR